MSFTLRGKRVYDLHDGGVDFQCQPSGVDEHKDLYSFWKSNASRFQNVPIRGKFPESVLLRRNTTSLYNHKYISFGYMFRFLSTISSPLFTIWRYIQCAHTLWDHVVFTYQNSYRSLKSIGRDVFWKTYAGIAISVKVLL